MIALALPGVGLLAGLLFLPGGGMGDYPGRLGAGVLFVIGLGAACALGAVAASIALFRGESRMWLSILSLLANLAIALPVVAVLLRR